MLRCGAARVLRCPQLQRRGLKTEVGVHLFKGPPGFVPGKVGEPGKWVPETVKDLSLVHAHRWFPEALNTEADNLIDCADLFAGRRVAIFGVPAPFTGTCTEEHVPGYQALQDDFVGKVIGTENASKCGTTGIQP